MPPLERFWILLLLALSIASTALAQAAGAPEKPAAAWSHSAPPPDGGMALQSSERPAGSLSPSLRNEVDAAIQRGLAWLVAQQKADGSWSDNPNPALTALPLWALARGQLPEGEAAMDRAIAALLRQRKPDGGLYAVTTQDQAAGSLSVYNTAVCLTALSATGRTNLTPVILSARRFIAGARHFGTDDYRGGFGYDRASGRGYTEMLTALHAVQAMRGTEDWERHRDGGEPAADINWSETVRHVERLQQSLQQPPPATTNAPTGDGSIPAPDAPYFRSYGSMTYSGLLALIYANVTREDVRVRTALDWAEKHWTMEENPGMGQQGIYFFYNVLTRALSASGTDFIRLNDGSFLDWREAVARKLISIQRIDPKSGLGYWENSDGQYWEDEPVLVTAYALLALISL